MTQTGTHFALANGGRGCCLAGLPCYQLGTELRIEIRVNGSGYCQRKDEVSQDAVGSMNDNAWPDASLSRVQ